MHFYVRPLFPPFQHFKVLKIIVSFIYLFNHNIICTLSVYILDRQVIVLVLLCFDKKKHFKNRKRKKEIVYNYELMISVLFILQWDSYVMITTNDVVARSVSGAQTRRVLAPNTRALCNGQRGRYPADGRAGTHAALRLTRTYPRILICLLLPYISVNTILYLITALFYCKMNNYGNIKPMGTFS